MKLLKQFLSLVVCIVAVAQVSAFGHGFVGKTPIHVAAYQTYGMITLQELHDTDTYSMVRVPCYFSQNPDQQVRTTEQRILGIKHYKEVRYVRIVLDNQEDNPLECAYFQEFFLPERQCWLPACLLRPGARLYCKDGASVTVTSVTKIEEQVSLYVVGIDKAHTFFVGQQCVLAHNADIVLTLLAEGGFVLHTALEAASTGCVSYSPYDGRLVHDGGSGVSSPTQKAQLSRQIMSNFRAMGQSSLQRAYFHQQERYIRQLYVFQEIIKVLHNPYNYQFSSDVYEDKELYEPIAQARQKRIAQIEEEHRAQQARHEKQRVKEAAEKEERAAQEAQARAEEQKRLELIAQQEAFAAEQARIAQQKAQEAEQLRLELLAQEHARVLAEKEARKPLNRLKKFFSSSLEKLFSATHAAPDKKEIDIARCGVETPKNTSPTCGTAGANENNDRPRQEREEAERLRAKEQAERENRLLKPGCGTGKNEDVLPKPTCGLELSENEPTCCGTALVPDELDSKIDPIADSGGPEGEDPTGTTNKMSKHKPKPPRIDSRPDRRKNKNPYTKKNGIYIESEKHGKFDRNGASAAPIDGQRALDDSYPLTKNSRIGIRAYPKIK